MLCVYAHWYPHKNIVTARKFYAMILFVLKPIIPNRKPFAFYPLYETICDHIPTKDNYPQWLVITTETYECHINEWKSKTKHKNNTRDFLNSLLCFKCLVAGATVRRQNYVSVSLCFAVVWLWPIFLWPQGMLHWHYIRPRGSGAALKDMGK